MKADTVEYNRQSFRGEAVGTGLIEAAARADMEVIKRILMRRVAVARAAQTRGAGRPPSLGGT